MSQSRGQSYLATLGAMVGFAAMMALDVALGSVGFGAPTAPILYRSSGKAVLDQEER